MDMGTRESHTARSPPKSLQILVAHCERTRVRVCSTLRSHHTSCTRRGHGVKKPLQNISRCCFAAIELSRVNTSMIYTFDFDFDQLDRCHDLVLTRWDMRIIHCVFDDLKDHYITVIDCDPATAVWLSLF